MLFLLFIQLLINVASQTILEDVLKDTDRFFEGFHEDLNDNARISEETEKFKNLIRRSYGFIDGEEHPLKKRSLDENSKLIHDEKGVFFVKNVKYFASLPIKFPTDIKIVADWEDNFYVMALEYNGDLPRNKLANHLVFYLLKEDGSWIELQRIHIAGGFRLGSSVYGNFVYLLSSEHNADVRNPFEGSSLYKISLNGHEQDALERIQILNISHPKDVKFWQHQDQMYLAVGTGSETAKKSFVFIFKWVKYNFDLIQKIEGNDVKSVNPFAIGSSMYLAVANYKDVYGNTNIDSKIFRFDLETEKFILHQRIKTQAAIDLSHFKFTDSKSGKEDHFIAVANHFERDHNDGVKKYRTDSFLFKFEYEHFVPFQNFKLPGIRQWVPVKGSQGEFLLIAICEYTVIGFQYNGWRFEEINLDFGQGSFGREIFSIRPFIHKNDVYISVADKNSDGSTVNIWKITFEHKNVLEKQYSQIEKWCNEIKSKIESENLIERKLNDLHFNFFGLDPNSSGDSKINLENAIIDILKTETFDVYNSTIIDDLNHLNKKIKKLKSELADIKQKFDKAQFIIYYNVTGLTQIPDMELKCPDEDCCSFENLDIKILNSIEFLPFINKTVTIEESIFESKLEFENFHVSHDMMPFEINGHPSETLIDTKNDFFINSKIIVNGSVIVQGNLRISDKFNDHFESELDVVQKCLKNFTGDLVLDFARVINLELYGKINGIPIDQLLENPTNRLINTFDKLVVQNLYVNGSMYGFDPSLEHPKTISDNTRINQEFDTLELDDIFVESGSISGVRVSNLIQITEGKHYQFDGGLNISDSVVEPNFLQVEESINGIPVDVFLKENYSVVSESEITVVKGEAFVEDIVDQEGKYSLRRLVENGVLLNSSVIRNVLTFFDVKIDEALIESINGVPITSWILRDSDQIQIVRGKKTFSGDIHVRGSLNVEKLNGNDLEDLYNNTLFLNGKQMVTGIVSFKEIAVTRLDCHFLSLDGNELQLAPNRVTIFGSILVDTLAAENVIVKGLIEGLRMDDALDPLYTNGTKVEKALHFDKAEIINSFQASLENKEEWIDLEMTRDVRLNNVLRVDELIFKGTFDSIPNSRFGKDWFLSEGDQTLYGHVIFENIKLNSDGILKNETIGNINMKNLFRDSIKINEAIHIKHLAINSIKAEKMDVTLNVNGAKFEDSIILAVSNISQTVRGEWFLDRDLIINGSFIIEGSVSGMDLSRICKLGKSESKEMNLIVGGSVRFLKEPKISVDVNGIDLKKISKEIWFGNENVFLAGGMEKMKFCQLEIHGKVNLNGKMNNLDLLRVSKNYLSKTLTKIVPGKIKIRNLIVRDSCRIHNGTLGGKLNGIDFEKWSKNVLLQDETQIITGRYYFNEFNADNIILNGTINGLNMLKDVLRYDVPDSIVTGKKTFLNLFIHNLIITEGKKIQEINVEHWAKRTLRKKGNFVIDRNLILENPIFKKDLKISGSVNDIIFDSDHILLTRGNQTVKAEKTFDLRNYRNETLYIKHLVIKAPVSGINVDALIENQAYKYGDSIFSGRKNFIGNLTVDHFKLNGLFQGENITGICSSLLNPPRLEEDFTQRYEKLLTRAKNLNKHFRERPFFLDYYEALQMINEDVFAVLPFSIQDESLVFINTFNEIKFMKWNSFTDQFSPKEEEIWNVSDYIIFATSVSTESDPYVYLEMANFSYIFGSQAKIRLPVNGTSCVLSFRLESLGQKLCFFVGRAWNHSQIFCKSSDNKEFHVFQTLTTFGSEKASVLEIHDRLYLTVINKENMTDRIDNILTVYRFDNEFKSFFVSSTLPVINPVAVSAITYKNHHFLVLAGGHLPESVDSSIVTIFRLNRENDVFIRYQSLLVDTPIDVKFAELPTSELVLYVLSLNPTRPFIVFSFKGIQGFVEETSGPSLYIGDKVDSFTISSGHFVIISGFGRGQILKAGFKGNKISINNFTHL